MLLNKFLYLLFFFQVHISNCANYINTAGNILFAHKVGEIVYVVDDSGCLSKYNLHDRKLQHIKRFNTSELQYFFAKDQYLYFIKSSLFIRFNVETLEVKKLYLPSHVISNPLYDLDREINIMVRGDQLYSIDTVNFKIQNHSVPLYSMLPSSLNHIYRFNDFMIVLQDYQFLIFDNQLKLMKKHFLHESKNSITNYVRYIGSNDNKNFIISKNNLMYSIDKNLEISSIPHDDISIRVYYSNGVKFEIVDNRLMMNNKPIMSLIGYNFNIKNIGKYVYVYNDSGGILYYGDKELKRFKGGNVRMVIVAGVHNMLIVNGELLKF
ncbi:MAG: hypothetical protein AAFO15_00715 [Pseudomonadota bacterium]